MITEKMQQAFLSQINKELYSEYLYLSMKAYFADKNLKGFVNWMSIQVQEEHAHAMGMFDYVIERGGRVTLDAIERPKNDWANPLEVFKDVLAHEEYVTSQINLLYDTALETKDRAAQLFLNWYIREQVEEEASAADILGRLELIGDDKHALLDLDKELMTRVLNPPVIG
ncbi:ferritin [bacterium]|nr:ferritin [bacterium]